MKRFNQKKFNEFIINQEIIGFFKEPIKLKSGRLSNWYVNWRNAAGDAYLLDKLTDYVIAFTEDLNLKPDCFYGVPEGATKLGVITQYKWAEKQPDYGAGIYSLPMGRAKPKDHGDLKDRYFVGTPKGKTIILEDVTTTGGSMLASLEKLQEIGIPVIACIGLTNRNEIRDDKKSVKETVEERKIPYYALSNAVDLLPEIYRRLSPGKDAAKLVEEYFREYGTEKIELI